MRPEVLNPLFAEVEVLKGVGPQIAVPVGPFRPYVSGTVGVAYFFTESSLSGGSEVEQFARSTNQSDANVALAGGGGEAPERPFR